MIKQHSVESELYNKDLFLRTTHRLSCSIILLIFYTCILLHVLTSSISILHKPERGKKHVSILYCPILLHTTDWLSCVAFAFLLPLIPLPYYIYYYGYIVLSVIARPSSCNLSITPLAKSFRRLFYVCMYHHAMKHHHTNIIVSLFSIPFVLKWAAKSLKIGP